MTPLPFRWSGDSMEIAPRFAKLADGQYIIGEVYTLAPVEERSEVSHRHEFAWLREAWLNLPERLVGEYPSPEALRKRALIATGWCTTQDYACGSKAEAVRWSGFLRKELDEYAIIIVSESVVRVHRAKSQARGAMNKTDFQASKEAVLQHIAGLIGVTPAALSRAHAA